MSRVFWWLRQRLSYLLALGRPTLRLERSPERLLMPLILALLTLLAVFATLAPLKLGAGLAYANQLVQGNLVVHIVRDDMPLDAFEAEISGVVSRLSENEAIARVELATGPDFAQSFGVLFGNVSADDQLYGGIVRLDLVERPGRDANVENLQFALSNFRSAYVDDHRQWREANARVNRQGVYAGLGILMLIVTLVAATLSLTIRLALKMHQRTLRIVHHLGATDGFAAMVFQATTFRRAVVGTTFGALIATGLLWLAGWMLRSQGYVGAAQVGMGQILTLILVPLILIFMAVLVARRTAFAALKQSY